MARLVMKFGGTSVATVERIKNAARHVKREFDAGHEVAVVVSAMSGKTNELVAWCKEAAPLHDRAEYDVVVASGEQVTSGLMAIATASHQMDIGDVAGKGQSISRAIDIIGSRAGGGESGFGSRSSARAANSAAGSGVDILSSCRATDAPDMTPPDREHNENIYRAVDGRVAPPERSHGGVTFPIKA